MIDDNKQALQALLPAVKFDQPVRDYTTMHVGGLAAGFIQVTTIEELLAAVSAAIRLRLPYQVIGSGSNIVVADEGYHGLFIRNMAAKVVVLPEENAVLADAGVTVARMLNEAAVRGLGGMEKLAGLPGTVGGALYGNAECWGSAVSDFLDRATVLVPSNSAEAQILSVEPEWFSYRYRSSKLKRMSNSHGKPIVLSARFKLRQKPREAVLADMKVWRDKRHEAHQPIGRFCSGSFFRNPGGSSHGERGLAPEETAGYLIDQAGGKKLSVGDAIVSRDHANFIVNQGQASASDIRRLAELVKATVRETYNTELEEEVEYVGEWGPNVAPTAQ